MSEQDSSFEISLGSIEEENAAENEAADPAVKKTIENMISNIDNMLEAQEAENDAKAVADIEASRRADSVPKNADAEAPPKKTASENEASESNVSQDSSTSKVDDNKDAKDADIEVAMAKDADIEISIFDEDEIDKTDSMLEERLDDAKDEHEHLANTEINGIPTELVVSKNKTKKMSDAEINERVEKAANNQIKKVKNEAAKLIKEQSEAFKQTIDEIRPGTELNARYEQLLNIPLYIPDECVKIERTTSEKDIERKYITMDSFVQVISMFDEYTWKANPMDIERMLHTLPDTFIICKRMESIFGYEFAKTEGTAFRLPDMTEKCLEFIGKYSELDDLRFEHSFIVLMLGKLEVLLNTNMNIWLKADMITVTNDVTKVFWPDVEAMNVIQSKSALHHMNRSWNTFVSALFNLNERKNMCFNIKTQGYEVLNECLKNSYCYNHPNPVANYQMEELIGNTLKMYSNTVVQSFYFCIRSLYIMIRLLSIYIQSEAIKKRKTQEEIAEDLSVIASFATVLYENKYWLWKEAERGVTKVVGGGELTPQAQVFIDNYSILGGQFFLLKAIEKALPTIAFKLL